MTLLVFLVALFFLSIGVAYEQSFRIYNEPDFKGNYITFRSKEPNTSDLSRFFFSPKSFSARGYWRLYSGSNFTGSALVVRSGEDEASNPNYTFPYYGASVGHAGLLETSQQSISFYSLSDLIGIERVITTPASNDIPFAPASILSTGKSNWTFFTGASFDGTATCYISTAETHYLSSINSTLSNVQSIIKGCLGRIDTFLFAHDCEDKSMKDFVLE